MLNVVWSSYRFLIKTINKQTEKNLTGDNDQIKQKQQLNAIYSHNSAKNKKQNTNKDLCVCVRYVNGEFSQMWLSTEMWTEKKIFVIFFCFYQMTPICVWLNYSIGQFFSVVVVVIMNNTQSLDSWKKLN